MLAIFEAYRLEYRLRTLLAAPLPSDDDRKWTARRLADKRYPISYLIAAIHWWLHSEGCGDDRSLGALCHGPHDHPPNLDKFWATIVDAMRAIRQRSNSLSEDDCIPVILREFERRGIDYVDAIEAYRWLQTPAHGNMRRLFGVVTLNWLRTHVMTRTGYNG